MFGGLACLGATTQWSDEYCSYGARMPALVHRLSQTLAIFSGENSFARSCTHLWYLPGLTVRAAIAVRSASSGTIGRQFPPIESVTEA